MCACPIYQPKSATDRKKKIADSVLLASFLAGVVDPAALTCLFVPRLRQPAMAVTLADQFGGPANIVTSIPLRSLAARFPPELQLDGKLQERFAVDKMCLSGTADLKWISESFRLLRANGMELLFVALASDANVAALITRVHERLNANHSYMVCILFDVVYYIQLTGHNVFTYNTISHLRLTNMYIYRYLHIFKFTICVYQVKDLDICSWKIVQDTT